MKPKQWNTLKWAPNLSTYILIVTCIIILIIIIDVMDSWYYRCCRFRAVVSFVAARLEPVDDAAVCGSDPRHQVLQQQRDFPVFLMAQSKCLLSSSELKRRWILNSFTIATWLSSHVFLFIVFCRTLGVDHVFQSQCFFVFFSSFLVLCLCYEHVYAEVMIFTWQHSVK